MMINVAVWFVWTGMKSMFLEDSSLVTRVVSVTIYMTLYYLVYSISILFAVVSLIVNFSSVSWQLYSITACALHLIVLFAMIAILVRAWTEPMSKSVVMSSFVLTMIHVAIGNAVPALTCASAMLLILLSMHNRVIARKIVANNADSIVQCKWK